MFLLQWFEQKPLWLRITLKFILLALIAIVDHASGFEISFSVFYLAPVATTAWIDGKRAGIFMSLLCGGVWLAADFTAGHEYSQAWIPFWNMGVRVGFFGVVAHAVAQVKQSQLREIALARMDGLTGLWNGRYFLELGAREAERCNRSELPLTVVYVDLDHFKMVNDTQGHAEGDALLKEVGRTIRQELRPQDIPARLGGDEFAFLLPEARFEDAAFIVRRLLDSLLQMTRARQSPVTFSVGAITFHRSLSNVQEMIKSADAVMYQVKKSGRAAIRHEVS